MSFSPKASIVLRKEFDSIQDAITEIRDFSSDLATAVDLFGDPTVEQLLDPLALLIGSLTAAFVQWHLINKSLHDSLPLFREEPGEQLPRMRFPLPHGNLIQISTKKEKYLILLVNTSLDPVQTHWAKRRGWRIKKASLNLEDLS